MDLELADYRRSTEGLQRQLEEKVDHQRKQEQTIAANLEQLDLIKKELGQSLTPLLPPPPFLLLASQCYLFVAQRVLVSRPPSMRKRPPS